MRVGKAILFWIATASLSLLPAIVGLSTKNGDSRRNGASGGQRKPLSPKSSKGSVVASSIAPTKESQNEDLLATVVKASSNRRKPRTATRPPAAPLVDSTLLRFLSTQKKQQQETPPKPEQPANPISAYFGSLTKAPEKVVSKTNLSDRETVANASDTWDSWLGQYSRNRVAKKLLTLGVEKGVAYEAGEAVQSHVRARTARRVVREFLKERDILWVNKEPAVKQELSNSSSSTVAQTENKPLYLQYGLDDVVDTLLQAGLTGSDVAAIFSHTPSVVLMMPRRIKDSSAVSVDEEYDDDGETLEETTTRSLRTVLCGTLKLRKYDARKVLRTCPGLLTKRGSRSAEQVINLLRTLGISTNSVARDKSALPVLLSRSPSALFRLVAFLSSDAVRMPVNHIGPLLRKPECADLLNTVAPVPRIEQARQSSNETSLSSLWGRNSEKRRNQINDSYRKMSTTAWTLRHEIGCANLGKIISAYPTVLLLDAEKQILPTAKYLMNELGIWEDDLPRVLQLYPKLLGMDVSRMKDVVSFFRSIEVEENALPSIFRAFPYLLTLDVEKDMAPVVDFLRGIGVANVGRFVTRLPPVLGYSIKNELIPKWKYLSEVCLYSRFELSRFPAYFSYPLDRVVKTRYEYLRDVKRVPTELLALDRILRFGDKDFATQVAGDKDGGAAFKQFMSARKVKRTGDSKNRRQRKMSKSGNAKKRY